MNVAMVGAEDLRNLVFGLVSVKVLFIFKCLV